MYEILAPHTRDGKPVAIPGSYSSDEAEAIIAFCHSLPWASQLDLSRAERRMIQPVREDLPSDAELSAAMNAYKEFPEADEQYRRRIADAVINDINDLHPDLSTVIIPNDETTDLPDRWAGQSQE